MNRTVHNSIIDDSHQGCATVKMAAAPLAKLKPTFSSSRAAMRSSKPTLLGFTSVSPKVIGVAILGSGAIPETAVWVTGWAKKQARTVQIHSLELLPDRLEKSVKVLNRLCEDTQHCTFEADDIKDAPQDLREHDVVNFNAAVRSTALEEENVLLSVVYRMRAGAFMLTRNTLSIKTMAYPVSGAALNRSE
ncbi:hypothetical protein AU210_007508 [Fusarium oxysporum f. sp. radicis-cucumerinum]|uniref:Uncharacterized protein n=1 Tax=Fusarium oxysporum f. sp. radicis-cucumerinum TaxID=327505 RepID=A0A2H3GWB0_FUSOX|nr:hypothetical protein AU210_007508 [Fusarium oxysporum f. sp. radicis-cucumerinum]